MVVYNVPIRFNDAELLKLLNDAGVPAQAVAPSIWNPGKFNCTAWRIQGAFPDDLSNKLLCDASKNITMTIVSMSEYQRMRKDSQSSGQNPSDNRSFTYANAARSNT